MRIAPRTMLCGIAWRVRANHVAGDRFSRNCGSCCSAAGDKASLVLAMAGLVVDHAYHARIHEASQLASEAWALAESVGESDLDGGAGLRADPHAKAIESAEWSGDMLRWSQRVIDPGRR